MKTKQIRHIYTLSQREYLITAKLPLSTDKNGLKQFRYKFIARFCNNTNWTPLSDKPNTLHAMATRLQRGNKDWGAIDKYLYTYLGRTASLKAIEKTTRKINKDLHECFTPKEIIARLEFTTEQTGGADQPIIDESLTDEPTAPKKKSLRKYTDEQNTYLLSEGLKIARPSISGNNKSFTLHSLDVEKLRRDLKEKFELDVPLGCITEKIRGLIRKSHKIFTKALPPETTSLKKEPTQKPEPSPKTNKSLWKVTLEGKILWEGEGEPYVDIAKSTLAEPTPFDNYYLIVNEVVIWTGSSCPKNIWVCEKV